MTINRRVMQGGHIGTLAHGFFNCLGNPRRVAKHEVRNPCALIETLFFDVVFRKL